MATMDRTCLKCGHSNNLATGDQLEACPKCGAIYSRVEAAMNSGFSASSFDSKATASKTGSARSSNSDPHSFAEKMREESIYPTYRSLTNAIYILGLCFAALWALASIVVLFSADGGAKVGGFVIGVILAIVTVFFSKLFREVSLMLCDMSDASIRTAHMLESQRTS